MSVCVCVCEFSCRTAADTLVKLFINHTLILLQRFCFYGIKVKSLSPLTGLSALSRNLRMMPMLEASLKAG